MVLERHGDRSHGKRALVTGATSGIGQAPGVEEFVRDRIGDGIPVEEAERRFIAEERPMSLLGRLIRPAEIANLITCVASDLASATTGAALRADGGVAPTIIP